MATGTGKTRTCIAMVDALMRAEPCREECCSWSTVLHCASRHLAAFKEHMPNEPRWPNVGEKLVATDRRIHVATYPTMLNIIRDRGTAPIATLLSISLSSMKVTAPSTTPLAKYSTISRPLR
jgi:type I site-specific restriction endonuclease